MVAPSGTTAGRGPPLRLLGKVEERVFLGTRATGSRRGGHSHLQRHVTDAGERYTVSPLLCSASGPSSLPPRGCTQQEVRRQGA